MKSDDDVLLVEGVLAAIQPFLSTHYKQVILQIINNLVYYFNMWHVYQHRILITQQSNGLEDQLLLVMNRVELFI